MFCTRGTCPAVIVNQNLLASGVVPSTGLPDSRWNCEVKRFARSGMFLCARVMEHVNRQTFNRLVEIFTECALLKRLPRSLECRRSGRRRPDGRVPRGAQTAL